MMKLGTCSKHQSYGEVLTNDAVLTHLVEAEPSEKKMIDQSRNYLRKKLRKRKNEKRAIMLFDLDDDELVELYIYAK